LGFYFGLAFVFLRFSMLHESITILTHINTYLALLTGTPAIVLSIAGGGLARVWQSRIGKFWLVFLGFLIASVPFASWRGEAAGMVIAYLKADFPVLFIVGGMILTWKEFKMLMGSLALSGVCTLAMEKMFSNAEDGRLSLSGGTIANSNDYAAHLLMLLPFMLWVILIPAARIYKAIFLGLIFAALFVDLKAGSRGALLGLGVGFLIVLLRGSGALRFTLAIAGPLALLACFSLLPASVLFRYSGLFSDQAPAVSAKEDTTGAADSSSARRYLLNKSLEYTFSHPLFGVGAGGFSSFEGGMSRAAGKHGQWQETHNAYTEISSEVGIPAAFCYIGAILYSLFSLNKIISAARRIKAPAVVATAFCCLLSIAMMATCLAFLTLGFKFYMPALTAMAIALDRILRLEFMNPAPVPASQPVAMTRIPARGIQQGRFAPQGSPRSMRPNDRGNFGQPLKGH